MSELFGSSHDAPTDASAQSDSNASFFQLSNLHLARPMRAWERKPTSPFQKHRSKKIWKRASATVRPTIASSAARANGQGDDEFSDKSKAVKKRCISAIERVNTQWESMESPMKRITTRTSVNKELVALREEASPSESGTNEGEDVDGTITEIVHEDGTTTDISDSIYEDKNEWVDAIESDGDEAVHNGSSTETAFETMTTDLKDGSSMMMNSEAASQTVVATDTTSVITTMPEGFATPVKRHRSVSKRLNNTSRRRTLPHAFAPQIALPKPQTTPNPPASHDTGSTQHQTADDHSDAVTASNSAIVGTVSAQLQDDGDALCAVVNIENSPIPPGVMPILNIADALADGHRQASPSTAKLRRSPRRKSSSPMKISRGTSLQPVPHIVAFSPIKKTRKAGADEVTSEDKPQPPRKKDTANNEETDEPSSPDVQHPNKGEDIIPQTPPTVSDQQSSYTEGKRNERTRLSDDTALLQAFLDRAARNKSTPVVYADEQDSQSSPAVIPASPATVNILGELDPNTTSPGRMSSHTRQKSLDSRDENESAIVSSDEDGDLDTTTPRTTRPDRTRRSERISTTAPAKITLRGIQDNLAVKRTPAQELFILTGRNTRANKADSIPPSRRVPELMAEMLLFSGASQQPVKKSLKKKAVAWNKNIMYFTLESHDEEDEVKEDDLAGQQATEAAALQEEPFKPLARQATPGKPRMRKLKPPTALGIPSISGTLSKDAVGPAKARTTQTHAIDQGKRQGQAQKSMKNNTQHSRIAQPNTRRTQHSRLPAPITQAEPSFTPSVNTTDTAPSLMSPPKRRVSLFAAPVSVDSVKSKLDFEEGATDVVGLSSPAKKPRKPLLFGIESSGTKLIDTTSNRAGRPTLSSPAKKRAKRFV